MITEKDIANKEEIGKDKTGASIYHIETKGGLSIVGKLMPSGQLKVLSYGSHPAIARHAAQQLDKSIQYAEHLYKAEGQAPIPQWDPAKAYQVGMWHAEQAGKYKSAPDYESKLKFLHHSDSAVKHLVASGARRNIAHRLLQEGMESKLDRPHPGHDEVQLEQSYNRVNNEEYPHGLLKKSE